MLFSHDIERSLLAVVDLVNSSPSCGGAEGLPDAAGVESFVRRHRVSDVDPRDFMDVASLRQVRNRFRRVFAVDPVRSVASRVNALLADSPVRPRLTDHDGYPWHIHYFAPDATLSEHIVADGGMALAQVVASGETDRLRVCEAPDCQSVLVDLSRNRSKRYCDARTCGNRLNVAAYRKRQASLLPGNAGPS